jgi:hypothetical protein
MLAWGPLFGNMYTWDGFSCISPWDPMRPPTVLGLTVMAIIEAA